MQPLQIGVCSWSLAIPDLQRTLATVRDDLGLSVVHLGLFDDSSAMEFLGMPISLNVTAIR